MNKGQEPRDDESDTPTLPWELPRFRNWIAVARVNQIVRQQLGDAIAGTGLDLPRFDLLAAIAREPGLTQSALASRLLVGRSNLSMLLPDLERRGWVRRDGDPSDRRVRRLHLSADGERVVGAALTRQTALIRHMLGVLSDEECERMGEMMRRVGRYLEEHPFADGERGG